MVCHVHQEMMQVQYEKWQENPGGERFKVWGEAANGQKHRDSTAEGGTPDGMRRRQKDDREVEMSSKGEISRAGLSRGMERDG